MSAITGIIPAICGDVAPLRYTCPLEMLPIGYTVIEGQRCFRPLSQVVVEGMVYAGADHLVFVINQDKLDMMRFYGNGEYFGVPFYYAWQRAQGLAAAIDTAYHVSQDHTVLVGLPGLTDMGMIRDILTRHNQSMADVTLSVAQNAKLDHNDNIVEVKDGQMAGVFVWNPSFTEYLRDYVSTKLEAEGDIPRMEEAFILAAQQGLRIKGVKSVYTPFIEDCESWSQVMRGQGCVVLRGRNAAEITLLRPTSSTVVNRVDTLAKPAHEAFLERIMSKSTDSYKESQYPGTD